MKVLPTSISSSKSVLLVIASFLPPVIFTFSVSAISTQYMFVPKGASNTHAVRLVSLIR